MLFKFPKATVQDFYAVVLPSPIFQYTNPTAHFVQATGIDKDIKSGF